MGDMYHFDKNLSSQDEISLFLRQILLRSSSPPSHSSMPGSCTTNAAPHLNVNAHGPSLAASQLQDGKILAVDSTASAAAACSSFKAQAATANVSSSSVGLSENENDDYDCESEEGVEALGEEVPTKPASRNSSKRSRAAEVHNLSEKRRRSRINEKMKALQNLIPNSNKTDKASMLDEAIEYLKQLQLQVQMLSMRNGLSLHPMCFPEGGLQALQLSQMGMSATLPLHQDNHPLHYASKHPSVPYPPYSETSFGLESRIQPDMKPLQHKGGGSSDQAIRGEDILHYQQSHVVKEFESGTTLSFPFDTQACEVAKDNNVSLQPCIGGRDKIIRRNSETNINIVGR